MISFSYNENDIKIRIKEIVLSQIKPCLIIGIVSLPFTIYFLLIGYLIESEALLYGYSSLFITVFMIVVSILIYYRYKKAIELNFSKTAKDNVINYTIEQSGNCYKVLCLENNKAVEFHKEDISKIYFMKNLIIVKLRSKKIIDFPNKKNILDLFKWYKT